tara:strand:+ start:1317 stop:1976 length:660 start_codon:yes stop_codon:yes gene_type:complete
MWRYTYTSDAYCKNYNCFLTGAKPVNVNSGSGSTLARKAATKYSKKLNNSSGNFSINGSSNHTYIGNTNNSLSYNHCKLNHTSHKSSVKNYSGLRGTRIVNSDVNNGIKSNMVNSFQTYLIYAGQTMLNKHNLYEKSQSQYLNIKKNQCSIDRSTYLIDLANANANSTSNTCSKQAQKCNITKDMNKILGYTIGYDFYINDKVKKGCNYNPPDARVIAC